MQLNIPVHQTITLPDEWQACKTPQELSYWLIAKLDGIQADIDALGGGEEALTELQQKVNTLNDRVVALTQTTIDVQGGIEENKTNIASNTSNIAALRTDLQTTNENLSGFEDRVNTNAASIEELKTRGVYLKCVFAVVTNENATTTVCFNYVSNNDIEYTTLSDVYNDIIERTPYPTVFVEASGIHLSNTYGSANIVGYHIGNDQWHFRYIHGGVTAQERYPSTATASQFSLFVQRLY